MWLSTHAEIYHGSPSPVCPSGAVSASPLLCSHPQRPPRSCSHSLELLLSPGDNKSPCHFPPAPATTILLSVSVTETALSVSVSGIVQRSSVRAGLTSLPECLQGSPVLRHGSELPFPRGRVLLHYSLQRARRARMLLIHSSVSGHLGCFHLLAVVSNGCTSISSRPCCEFFWIYTQKWNWWIIRLL